MAFVRGNNNNSNNGPRQSGKWGGGNGGFKKKYNSTRAGNMFKSKHKKENVDYQYYMSIEGKYLEAVVEAVNKHANEAGVLSFTLTKYSDAEYPALYISAGKPKDSKAIRRSKNDSFHDAPEQNEEQEEVGL